MNEQKNQSWLIRDNTNVIRGPYSQTEVANLIKKGQLKGKTEVACANSYWFALDEKVEVAKFFPELGLKMPEQPTQMTATLTQAEVAEQLEATQVIVAPKPAEAEPEGEGEAIQWLSDEFADEFGEDAPESAAPGEPASLGQTDADNANTQELVINDLLNRSSVKNDTLPSERKDFKGDKPMPINSLLRNKERSPQPGNVVQVPVGRHESPGKILPLSEEPPPARPANQKKIAIAAVGVLLVGAAIVVATGALNKSRPAATQSQPKTFQKRVVPPLESVRRALLLFDLEEAKAGIADLELQADSKGGVVLPIAQALLKKEFLYDTDGAFMALQTARSLAKDKSAEAEIDNLMAIYRFDKDRGEALDGLRRVSEAFPATSVFRYNLALAQMRAGHPKEAIAIATRSVNSASDPISEDMSILLAWARDAQSKGTDPSIESAYQRALEINPFSAKARLGLAIYRLRKGGMKASEMDFRAFIESLPELDPPSQVVNFRKMSDFDFFNFARAQLRDLNVPLGAAGSKPSPLVMAVDAILSCLQSRTGEAGKILEVALTGAPGDSSILKAMGYHRFKEGRHAEVIDLLKELARERSSYAVNLLVGKAQAKTGRRDEAKKYFEQITAAEPSRSEGWSLLGDLQLQRGQGEEARKNLRNALQRNPGDILALRGLEQLGEAATSAPELAGNLPF